MKNRICKDYVDIHGKITSEPSNIEYAVKPLIQLYGSLLIHEFGPLKLLELRDKLIQDDWNRSTINRRISMIKRMFKWAVSRQIASPVVYQGLANTEGLNTRKLMKASQAKLQRITGFQPSRQVSS